MNLHVSKFGKGNKNLIVLHGLLGSSDNWKTLAAQWADYLTVYTIDVRNHGLSDHSELMNYDVMADDIDTFITETKVDDVIVLGHSMGGKIAMTLALKSPDKIDKLIIADIAPVEYDGGHESIFKAMTDLPLSKINKRNEADEWMQSRIPNKAVRQFILKNLKRDDKGNYSWKVNLNAIITNYKQLSAFPEFETTFDKPTLFIKGSLSDYINPFHINAYKLLFPKLELKEIQNVGHWLHAEAPQEFFGLVLDFIQKD